MTIYLQILSMTDHTQAFGRFQGQYEGLNASLVTSTVNKNGLCISSKALKISKNPISHDDIKQAKLILCYRHVDSGELKGSSETLFAIEQLPFADMPGLYILDISQSHIRLKIFDHEFSLKANEVFRIQYGKSVVYLKNFGPQQSLQLTDEILYDGPSKLHGQVINQDITLGVQNTSAFVVKQGQEIKH